MNTPDMVRAVMEYDELIAARERFNAAVALAQNMGQVRVSVEDKADRENRAIRLALWHLKQGHPDKAKQVLGGVL